MSRTRATMACLERIRLQQLYEDWVRRWVQVHTSSLLVGPNTYITEDVQRRVLSERNAARKRLAKHRENCTKCCSRTLADETIARLLFTD
jgi:hypothetical protein